jgi:DNA-binding transcriptional regulator PaaX
MLDGERVYKISHKGGQKLQRYQALKVDILPRFDGHWYLVTFDIAESHKSVRNQLILTLKRHGFVQYSGGVWVLPYNPQELINKLRKELSLDKQQIRLISATHIDGTSDLKRKFKLK